MPHVRALHLECCLCASSGVGAPLAISVRFHWPMQGPQALASTVPPTFSNTSIRPSRAIVARICSLPGVMVKGTCARRRLLRWPVAPMQSFDGLGFFIVSS